MNKAKFKTIDLSRRKTISRLTQISSLSLISAIPFSGWAHHTLTHFEDDSEHHVVYSLNKADNQYIGSILFSAGELLRKYGDDVEIVIVCFGPGIQLLGKKPTKKITPIHQKRAASLAEYGVAFHACGNTMKSLNWTEEDLLPFAGVVPIGADDLMLLQERGFALISW